ncbi:MAG: chromate transporter [Dethiobacteria bacterium]
MLRLLLKLFYSYLKIGFFSFGGGYAMLALMEHEIIRINHWITTAEFIDLIAVAEMTPGPVAINSATFVGYRIAGFLGATLATTGVVFPSLLLVLPSAKLFTKYYGHPTLERALSDIKPAVIALISLAAFVLGKSAITDLTTSLIAAACLLLLILGRIHPLTIIGLGALAGLILHP